MTTPATEIATSENVETLIARLSEPKTTAALLELLDNLATLSGLLEAVGTFLGRSEEIIDNAADSLREMSASAAASPIRGLLGDAAKVGVQALPVVGKLADADAVERLVNSSLLDPGTLDLLVAASDAVAAARTEMASAPAKRYGLFSLAAELKDPDVSAGLDFGIRTLKKLGATLRTQTQTEGTAER